MKFFIIAGEESGEIYGARLMRELKRVFPGASFAGIGGDRMAAEGLEALCHCREMSAIGLAGSLFRIPFYVKTLRRAVERMTEGGFDALILIDFPDFNFRAGRAAAAAGIPVFYYVCPQLWAWRRYRARSVKKWADTMLVILPFEEEFYARRGVNAKFVGHPMLDEITAPGDSAALRKEFLPEGANLLVGLLPGSRKSEVSYMLGPLLETADIIHSRMARTGFVIPVAPHMSYEEVAASIGGRSHVKALRGRSHAVMAASDLLVSKSGTSTLEGMVFGAPMIIVYRFGFFSYRLARALSREKFAGLPNIIAGKEIAREFLQNDFRPSAVADHALFLLEKPERLEKARGDMAAARVFLGEKGAAGRAAGIMAERLERLKGGVH